LKYKGTYVQNQVIQHKNISSFYAATSVTISRMLILLLLLLLLFFFFFFFFFFLKNWWGGRIHDAMIWKLRAKTWALTSYSYHQLNKEALWAVHATLLQTIGTMRLRIKQQKPQKLLDVFKSRYSLVVVVACILLHTSALSNDFKLVVISSASLNLFKVFSKTDGIFMELLLTPEILSLSVFPS
jgi:hypothetical protein